MTQPVLTIDEQLNTMRGAWFSKPSLTLLGAVRTRAQVRRRASCEALPTRGSVAGNHPALLAVRRA